jgi:hypothetical protein
MAQTVLDQQRGRRPDRSAPVAVRGRLGSKHHLITDAGGIPLAVLLTGGNRNDVTQLLPLHRIVQARCSQAYGKYELNDADIGSEPNGAQQLTSS